MVVRISGSAGITFNDEPFASETYVNSAVGGVVVKEKRIAAFTSNGTWTVPAGVTYAIAHIQGAGGGGNSQSALGSDGGASSVAFASGTITAGGGDGGTEIINVAVDARQTVPANSGRGGGSNQGGDGNTGTGVRSALNGMNGGFIVAGAAVTPGASITVTVGLGGSAGASGFLGTDGADGYVYIEYEIDPDDEGS